MKTRKQVTMEKTAKVRDAMAKKKFPTIEEACAHFEISPASYYNYVKKLPSAPTVVEGMPAVPMTRETWSDELSQLRSENEFLKTKLQEGFTMIQKLEKALLGYVLAEVSK